MDAYEAARESAVLFDRSDSAKIELAGRDAREFLANLCTQDVKNLPVGETREAFLTTNKARVVAHVWITHREADVLLVEAAAGQTEAVLSHLNHYLISEQVELADRTADFALFRLIGPKAADVAACAGFVSVRAHRLLALDGIDGICPAAEADAARRRILEAGAVPGDAATYEILRVEAGLPLFGIDIDADRLAMEVNRPLAISFTKGCYLGQETIVMARDRGQVNRRLMGVKLGPACTAPLPFGAKLFRDGAEIGSTTSSVFSPWLKQVIALAYLKRGNWDEGMEITAGAPEGAAGVVAALPFSTVP